MYADEFSKHLNLQNWKIGIKLMFNPFFTLLISNIKVETHKLKEKIKKKKIAHLTEDDFFQ